MTLRLHFGVNDIPYGAAYQAATSRRPGPRPGPAKAAAMNRMTTGDVAEILEARYHLMETYVEHRKDFIGEVLVQAMHDKIEAISTGQRTSAGPLLDEMTLAPIAEDFRKALDDRAFNGIVAGVPTQAALRGVNHRLAHPYARRASRPSFVDTGLYQANIRVWSD